MRRAEVSSVNRGSTFASLMETAGTQSAEIIFEEYGSLCENTLVICGKGNNGGDGFVIARRLGEKGCKVKVYLPCGEPETGIALDNYKLLDKSVFIDENEFEAAAKNSGVIIDCVFGTGFKGALDEKLSAAADFVNSLPSKTVSIDIPSGAICDEPAVKGGCFKADMTVAISAFKPVHIIKPVCEYCGKVKIAGIGIDDKDFTEAGSNKFTFIQSDVAALLPARPSVSNKGTFGNALIIAGSYAMPGAAKIASKGALVSGAGLVTLAFPDAAYNAVAPAVTEQVMFPCESNDKGTFSSGPAPRLIEKANACTSVLIGCGMGVNGDTAELVGKLLENTEKPLVIDADALNCLSQNTGLLKTCKTKPVLTPHPGEMSRLTGKSVEEITRNPVETALEFTHKYNCVLLLKGANTVISESGSENVYINKTGNSGLAKGGSGDFLAGITVSLIAQGMNPFDAACTAAFLHGDCADSLADFTSERGMTVTKIAEYMPAYLKKYE